MSVKSLRSRRGVTRLEFTFIAIIVAILAALLIPYWMMSAQERAVHEGETFLKTIRASQINLRKVTGGSQWRDATSDQYMKTHTSLETAPGWIA
ncbi:MAG TPA: hypothetical protein VJA00_00235, partial [Candidatus Omnitrophota bacterium]|nr:hypothetical protein [Candidatus Omnitrophota bacterium]